MAMKVLFFEMLRDLKLAEKVPPWLSQVRPRPLSTSSDAEAFWDVPVYADHTFVRSNRLDARFVDHKSKKVLMVEMSCLWLERNGKGREVWTSTTGAVKTTPRIQDHTIECHYGCTWRLVQGA